MIPANKALLSLDHPTACVWYRISRLRIAGLRSLTVLRCMPNLPTNIIPTKIAWHKLSGKSPVGLRIPPLKNQDYAWVKPPEIHNVSREIGRFVGAPGSDMDRSSKVVVSDRMFVARSARQMSVVLINESNKQTWTRKIRNTPFVDSSRGSSHLMAYAQHLSQSLLAVKLSCCIAPLPDSSIHAMFWAAQVRQRTTGHMLFL